MKKHLLRSAAIVTVLLLHIVLLILIVYLGFFRVSFMEKECDKYQVSEKIGISRQELHSVLENMIRASLGRDSNLDITVSIGGQDVLFFNERDRQHLADISELSVKVLASAGGGLLCIIMTAFCLIRQKALKLLCKAYLWSWLGWIIAAGLTGVFIATDLTGFIDGFHRVFFQSNSWILNPAKDRLIWLFPKELFRDAAVMTAICFTVIHGIFTVTAIGFLKGAPAH